MGADPYAASAAERRRIGRWVRGLLGHDHPEAENQTHMLCLIFESMLRDRLPEWPLGPLERRHLGKIAAIRLRAGRKGRKRRLEAISRVRHGLPLPRRE
jgi:hypothetical protein